MPWKRWKFKIIKASNEEMNSVWSNSMPCAPVEEVGEKKMNQVTIFPANLNSQIETAV